MIKVILSDFARVILLPKDKSYNGRLDVLEEKLKREQLNYNPLDYFELNQELLEFFQSIKNKIPLYIYTSGSNYTEPGIYDKLTPIFNDFFYSVALGKNKTNPDSYTFLAKKFQQKPVEIFFIDDEKHRSR